MIGGPWLLRAVLANLDVAAWGFVLALGTVAVLAGVWL